MDAPRGTAATLGELAAHTGATLIGDDEKIVDGAALPDEARPSDLTFVPHPRFARELKKTQAAALITDLGTAAEVADELPCATLASDNPHLTLARALERLYPDPPRFIGVDDRAIIHVEAKLAPGVAVAPLAVVGRARVEAGTRIAPFVFVDDDVEIGPGCFLGPGAVLLRGTRLGAGVLVHPGAVLGADGFQYAPDDEENVKVPQVHGVRVADRVEIGANACLDRGGLRHTTVGRGTKIDNLVQLGHGVQVGEHAVLIAQTGVGGDTDIGKRALLAGQTGVVHNAVLGDGVRVGAKAGVTRDMPAGAAWSGIPAYPHLAWLKTSARQRHLDDVFRRLKEAEAEIERLRQKVDALTGEGAKEPGSSE